MFLHPLFKIGGFVLGCLAGVFSASAQFTINGVTDRSTYTDAVTLSVPAQAGYTYSILLNTTPVAAGVSLPVTRPDFYELNATRTETATGTVTNRYIRFIVRASERGGTEWGLPVQVPFPVIPSSSQEFAGAHLRVIVPQEFPAGYEIPVVAWVLDDENHAVRANGALSAAGHPAIAIKRGTGSGFLAATNPAGAVSYAAQIGGLSTNKTITVESATTWTTVSGTLSDTAWPENSRIHVTGGLTIPLGSTLTVGAGSIVRLNSRVDITNNGTVTINGTVDRPVVFMPTVRTQPWGGFVMRTTTGEVTATGTIFTGSGAEPNWFGANGNPGSHRREQGLFYCNGGQRLNLTDSAAIYMAGQLGHSVSQSTATDIRLTGFLMQRCTTGGEWTGANFRVNDSAFIECPDDSANYVDGDNDALYLVTGTHGFTNTLFGWTKDDGIDSGGDGVGTLNYQNCWFEAIFHEGNSLSGAKTVFTRGTVYLDCGQGLEDGYGGPVATAIGCFFGANQSGARFGDNYPDIGAYTGFLTVTNSLLLYNHRDILGRTWRANAWTNELDQMNFRGNLLTFGDTNHPHNSIWNPAADAGRLAIFNAPGHVGVALALRSGQTSLASFPDGVPVGLSRFCSNQVTVDYSLNGTDGTEISGTLVFPPGLTRAFIPLPASVQGVLRVALLNPVHADLTGASSLLFQNLSSLNPAPAILSPLGANWRYLDDGSDQGTAWRAADFDDGTWSNAVARLGFGTDVAAVSTIRRTNPSGVIRTFYFRRAIVVTNLTDFATIQFRYQRDDGCIVFLNGNGILTNNMPASVNYQTLASSTVSGSAEALRYWTNTLSATLLQPGTNVIAAEVHQVSTTSSDIAWEMELQGLPTPPPPRVAISQLGDEAIVYWSDASLFLDQAEDVAGPWSRVAGSTSPWAVSAGAQKFYRLSKP